MKLRLTMRAAATAAALVTALSLSPAQAELNLTITEVPATSTLRMATFSGDGLIPTKLDYQMLSNACTEALNTPELKQITCSLPELGTNYTLVVLSFVQEQEAGIVSTSYGSYELTESTGDITLAF